MKQEASTDQGIPIISPHSSLNQKPLSSHEKPHYNHHSYILRTLFLLLLVFLILINIYDLLTLLVLRPTMLQVSLQKASLVEFSLRHRRILSYNLTLDVSVRNPNKRSGFFYERLQAMAFYGEEQFAEVSLPCFYQAPLNVSMLRPSFAGQLQMDNSYVVASDFILQRAQGWFQFDVNFFAEVRLKLGPVNATSYSAVVTCGLVVPLASTNSSQDLSFNWTKCVAEFPSLGFVPRAVLSSSYCIVPFILSLLYSSVLIALRFV
ncbi:NDR1/HIN1-like protein 10 [Nymphaea colorata]|nr:NDR1/HIN1-like protein 10 [Nymphaea colorata]